MNIGTAKPSKTEMEGIPHHLLDIVSPDENFSAAEFQYRATAAIAEITARGKSPIIAGGTGFYINALLYGTEFSPENETENTLREELTTQAKEFGAEFLHEKLRQKDPAYAATIHANNVKRVARALAYCQATGGLFSEHNAEQKRKREIAPSGARIFVLTMPREVLYSRINARVLAMFEAGLVEEVRKLLAMGYHKGLAAMCGIGYKEIVQLLSGEISQEEAIAAISQSTRNYAKRQETWFRNQTANACVLQAHEFTADELADEISDFLHD